MARAGRSTLDTEKRPGQERHGLAFLAGCDQGTKGAGLVRGRITEENTDLRDLGAAWGVETFC